MAGRSKSRRYRASSETLEEFVRRGLKSGYHTEAALRGTYASNIAREKRAAEVLGNKAEIAALREYLRGKGIRRSDIAIHIRRVASEGDGAHSEIDLPGGGIGYISTTISRSGRWKTRVTKG